MSLVAMMSLTVWATQHILVQAQSTDVCCLAYADNWAVITSALEQLDKAVSALTDLVRLLRYAHCTRQILDMGDTHQTKKRTEGDSH